MAMMADKILKLTAKLYNLTLLFPKKEPLRYKMREVAIELLTNIVIFTKNSKDLKIRNQILGKIETDFELLENFFQIVFRQNWLKKEKVLSLKNDYLKIKGELLQNQNLEVESLESENLPPKTLAKSTIQARIMTLGAEFVENKINNPRQNFKQPAETENQNQKLNPDFLGEMTQQNQEEKVPVSSNFSFKTLALPDYNSLALDSRQKKVLKILQEKRKVQIGELAKIIQGVSKRTLLRDLEKIMKLGYAAKSGSGRGAFYQFQLKNNPSH
jgi:hypothetical protein